MTSIIKKELNSFLSSLSGYMVILVFLTLNGLFLWIFPGSFNLLDLGYAGLDGLFFIAPWVFLFLIPALTMRFFSDEIKSGTLELLLTKPITEFKLVLGKYITPLRGKTGIVLGYFFIKILYKKKELTDRGIL